MFHGQRKPNDMRQIESRFFSRFIRRCPHSCHDDQAIAMLKRVYDRYGSGAAVHVATQMINVAATMIAHEHGPDDARRTLQMAGLAADVSVPPTVRRRRAVRHFTTLRHPDGISEALAMLEAMRRASSREPRSGRADFETKTRFNARLKPLHVART